MTLQMKTHFRRCVVINYEEEVLVEMGIQHELLIHISFTDFSTRTGLMTKITVISLLLYHAFLCCHPPFAYSVLYVFPH
jgi:hypothetical protein